MNADKMMRAIFAELLSEIRTNAALRARIEHILEQHVGSAHGPATRPHRRKAGPFDPMQVYRDAPEDLAAKLEHLDMEQLRDVVAEHGMDRTKLAMKWKSKARLIELIVATVKARAQKGDAFRTPRDGPDSEDGKGGSMYFERVTGVASITTGEQSVQLRDEWITALNQLVTSAERRAYLARTALPLLSQATGRQDEQSEAAILKAWLDDKSIDWAAVDFSG